MSLHVHVHIHADPAQVAATERIAVAVERIADGAAVSEDAARRMREATDRLRDHNLGLEGTVRASTPAPPAPKA